MWKRLLVTAVSAVCVIAATPTEAEACSCLPPNLQQAYGNSTDVVSARIVSSFSVGQDTLYRAKVVAAYKGCSKRGQTIFIQTPNNGAACGVFLQKKSVYLITGTKKVGAYGKDVISIHSCAYNVLWSSLSGTQKDWLKHRYVCCEDKCHCADGSQPVQCFVDPCQVTDCPMGECTANYCGGCHAEYYTDDGIQWCAPCESDQDCAWSQVCSAAGECVAYCQDDADCPDDHWCSPSQDGTNTCKPFQQEGDWCGGFTPVWAQAKCAPGLICTDVPPFIADAPGTCRKPCDSDDECGKEQYCSASGVCRDWGACWEDKDCNNGSNQYPHIACVGFGYCTDDGMCGWECGGGGSCDDLSGYDFGPCDAILGIGIVNGSCEWISGCSAEVKLFESFDACAEACGCHVDGVLYEPGASFDAGDGCNTCYCNAGGQAYCTKIACIVACEYEGEWYEVGETFPAADKCNTCTCLEDGSVACTEKACPKGCYYNGEWYEAGDSFPADDGCNTCFCGEDGSVGCTEMACLGCEYNGAYYQPGESFPAGDGCNTCSCMIGGQVACTLMACPPTCEYGGEIYLPGDTFPSGDGCNECMCGEDGMVGCTKKACIPDGCTVDHPCNDNWSMCWAPGQSLPCGACFVPEPWMTCESDAECDDGTVCDWDDGGCYCEPVKTCIPACTMNSQCDEGESCYGGHCDPTECSADSQCPNNFDCVSGMCKRQTCSADSDCFAWCVNGQCYDGPGYCSPPPP